MSRVEIYIAKKYRQQADTLGKFLFCTSFPFVYYNVVSVKTLQSNDVCVSMMCSTPPP